MRRHLFVALAAAVLGCGFVSATFLALRQPLSMGDYLAVWGLKPVDDPAPLLSPDILAHEFIDWVQDSHLLRRAFRARFREGLAALAAQHDLPPVDPAVWVLDEAFDGLDDESGNRTISYINQLIISKNVGGILVSHDSATRAKISNRSYKIKRLWGKNTIDISNFDVIED